MNLIFQSIEINNFLSIKSATVNFENQGIVLVEGINNDTMPIQSNGSGKSSIFDAILWTIYGETFRGISDVENIHGSDGVFCKLIFTIDNIRYIINRSKHHSIHKSNTIVFQDDAIITDSIKKSQEFIDKIFGISSAKVLGSIVLLGQGLPYKFSGLSQNARKDLLEQISGTDDYIEQLQTKLNIEQGVVVNRLRVLENTYHTYEGSLQSHTTTLNSLTASKGDISVESINKEIDDNNKNIEDYTAKAEECDKALTELKEILNQYNTKKIEINNKCIALSTECKTLESQCNTMDTECPVCHRPYDNADEVEKHKSEIQEQISEKKSQIDALKTELEEYSKSNNIPSVNQQISTFEQNKSIWQSRLITANNQTLVLQNKLENLKTIDDQIENLENGAKHLRILSNSVKTEIGEQEYYLEHIKWLLRESSREFKGVLLTDVIESFSRQAQRYSKYLLDTDLNISLDGNKVLITVGTIPYESLSGGEKQRVDLSLQFALRHMLHTTTGFSCNLLVLDEIFDNLDVQGIERLNQLIMSELTDIESIYVVTHHSDVNVAYDKKITISKSNGISKVLYNGS